MLDEDVFMYCMDVLMGVFKAPLAAPAINGYYEVLKTSSDTEMEAATHIALERGDRMPTPSKLLGYIRGVPDQMAERAWFDFLAVFRKHGASKSIECGDPRTALALRAMGGLCTLARRNAQDFAGWAKRDFIMAYKDAWEGLETGRLKIRPGDQTITGSLGRQSLTVSLPAAKKPPAKELAGRVNRSQLPDRGKSVLLPA